MIVIMSVSAFVADALDLAHQGSHASIKTELHVCQLFHLR
jgi:hypothetical protein